MPYKDVSKRKEVWSNWYKKNTEAIKIKKQIRNIATYHNKERKECSVKGCQKLGERHHYDYCKPKNIIWLCKKHHELEHHKNTCIICGDKHLAKGYCNKHYKIFIVKSKPLLSALRGINIVSLNGQTRQAWGLNAILVSI